MISAAGVRIAAADVPTVGQRVADFELPVVGGDGKTAKLSDALKKGPVAVIVLRGFPGYQCPLCSRQYGELRNRAAAFGKSASQVFLIYPGPMNSLETRAKQFAGQASIPAPLTLVRDDDMKMVSNWGLRWNGRNETAYPSAFVVN
ncbi:MAG: redoxin domain-containing protein, partial [Planctomycetota bacterium]